MPINLGIYGNIEKPDVGNALQAYATGLQARGQQQQNRLAAMQMEAAQRQQQQQDALNNAYKGNIGPDGQINYAGVQSALAGSGAGAQIPGVAKSAAEAQSLKLEQAAKVLTLQKSYATQVMAAPTLANALASLDSMEAVTGKGSMDSERARLTAIGDNPEQIRTWAAGHALDADKMLPHYSTVDTGGQVQTVGINPITGQTTQTGAIPKTMAPGQVAQLKQSSAKDAAEASYRSQDIDLKKRQLEAQIQQQRLEQEKKTEELNLKQRADARAQQQADADAADRKQSKSGAIAGYNTAIESLDGLLKHPGFSAGVGATLQPRIPFYGEIPGTDKAGFVANLDAFKSQTFLPMVQSLHGMGALSDAEGKKLTAAVGALDASMSENEFKLAASRIRRDLIAARNRAQSNSGQQSPGQIQQPAATHGYATPQAAYADYVKARNAAYQAKNMDLVRRIDAEAKADGITK